MSVTTSFRRSVAAERCPAPLVNEGDTEEDEQTSQATDETNDSSARRRRALAMVKEDMMRLERIFQEKSMKYRLIERIGEGTLLTTLHHPYVLTEHQEHSQPFTKPKT